MIHIFRKEMKKWHTVLWVIVVSFAISGTSMIFFRGGNLAKIKIAHVNGFPINLKRYRQAHSDIQRRIGDLQTYAKLFGASVQDILLEFFGKSSVSEIALDSCIRENLLDQIKDDFDIRMSGQYFQDELVKTLPQGIIDERGRIDMNSYQAFLSGRALTLTEFEDLKEEEFKRDLIGRCIAEACYSPRYYSSEELKQNTAQKSFDLVLFPLDYYIKKAQEKTPSDKQLQDFFEKHKERYRVPEYRKADYWEIAVQDYAKKISLEEDTITAFYEKNKSSKFRIAPKMKVRHIFIKDSDQAFEKAKKLHEQVKEKPDTFADLAKKNSDDTQTASQGGLTKLFERGTYDTDFEQAAFRLQKEGELSGIVKIKGGYEIIRLEERVKASFKPLEDVRAEIVKSLVAKKALSRLKSELEVMLHAMKSSNDALADFMKKNELEQSTTGNLSKESEKENTFEGHIAKRIFSPYKGQSAYGYFFHDEKYIIYKHSDTQKSYIRPLNENKDEVLKYYYKKEAKALIKNAVRKVREDFFAGKTTLADTAKNFNLEYIQVEKTKKSDKPERLSKTGTLLEKMFDLTDKSQLLQYKHNKNYYLAQLVEDIPSKDEKGDKETENIKNEKILGKQLFIGAFIEFLKRNAKIEIDKKILKGYHD
ncbi:MAG: peptidylprolyl isomerase [bacterium]